MTETISNNGPTPEPLEDARLFNIHQGSYGEVIVPWTQAPAAANQLPAAPPEVKKILETPTDEMIKVALMDRLIPDIYGLFDERREAFIKQYHWTPYSEAEVTAAIGDDRYGNPGLVSYLHGAQERGGLSAVRNVMKMVDGARADSTGKIEMMREAQDVHSGAFIPQAVRNNQMVRQILSREVFARNSLNLFEWPRIYLERSKRLRPNPKVEAKQMNITERIAGLTDEQILDLCNKTFRHLQARASFWAKQSEAAKQHRDTQDQIAAAESHA